MSLYRGFQKQYGERGREVFYRYMRKHGYDEEKPRKGQKSKVSKAFLPSEPIEVVTKQFYGATVPIVKAYSEEVAGEVNYYQEGFLSAPIEDIHGETISEGCINEWAKECVAPPHNLMWLFHESPYKKPENKDKPAILKIIESKVGELVDRLGAKHRGLWYKAIYNKAHPRFQEIYNLVKTGFINSTSVEFIPLLEDTVNKIVKKAKYLASCLVMAPANDLATITATYAKSFTGAKITSEKNMKEKTQNVPEPTPTPAITIPDLDSDSLDALLQERDRRRAQLIGAPIPNVVPLEPNLPLTVPPPAEPPQPAPPTAVPTPPTPAPDVTTQKIDQILSNLGTITQRLDVFDQRLKVVEPQKEPDPTPKEIQKVMMFLAEHPERYSPVANPPEPNPSDISTKAVWSPNEDWVKREDIQEFIDEAREEGKRLQEVVRKGVNEAMPNPTDSTTDLSDTELTDPNSIEGMLKKMFRK